MQLLAVDGTTFGDNCQNKNCGGLKKFLTNPISKQGSLFKIY